MRTLLALAMPLLFIFSPLTVCTAQTKALADRSAQPRADDINTSITLDSLLAHSGQSDWSTSKAAVVEGYVVQIEKEEDGDYHIVLASRANENDATKWVITEITPQWRTKSPSLSVSHLRKLYGDEIRVTGWLYYDANEKEPDPRGTMWEIHPVTKLEVLKAVTTAG